MNPETATTQAQPTTTPSGATARGSLWDDGALVDLSISFFRGHLPLEPDDVKADKERLTSNVKLGHKKLFENDVLMTLQKAENRARGLLRRYGLTFPVGSAIFVPHVALAALERDLEASRATFKAAWADFLAGYETNRDAMLKKYPAILKAEHYPAKDTLSFRFEWHTFTLSPTSQDAAKRIRNAVEEFVRDSVSELRKRVAETCRAQRTRLQEGKSLSTKQLGSLRLMIDQFRTLNFAGDVRVEAALDGLRSELDLRDGTLKAGEDDDARVNIGRVLDTVIDSALDDSSFEETVGMYAGRSLDLSDVPAAPPASPEPAPETAA